MSYVKGLDASSIQGNLPIKGLYEDGCRFLIHKCKQGNDARDKFFDRNTDAAKAAGMYTGAYHFLYPLPHLNPEKQAEGFFEASSMGATSGELPPSLDLEWPDPDKGFINWGCTPEQVCDWARRCAERTEELFGRKPMIYTYPYFASKLFRPALASCEWVADYPLWIASYAANPIVPKPWSTWTVWQSDGNGGKKMPNGIDADFDVFNGEMCDLEAFVGATHERHGSVTSIVDIQLALSILGYHAGPKDGVYGAMTRAAIMAFQADTDLSVDGVAGPKTKAALLERVGGQ